MMATVDPRWPRDATGPRALVECDDPVVQDGLVRALRQHGYAVAACAGPHARAAERCPLVDHGSCGLVTDADVVVHTLDAADPGHREVLAAVRRHAPDVPVLVESTGSGNGPEGCEILRYPLTTGSVIDAVDRVCGPR